MSPQAIRPLQILNTVGIAVIVREEAATKRNVITDLMESLKVFVKRVIIVAAFSSLFISMIPIQSIQAQSPYTVNIGEDKVFTSCNHHLTWYDQGPPGWGSLPEEREAYSGGNTAQVSLSATPGHVGYATATVGIFFNLNLGKYSLQEVQDWPVYISLAYSYQIGAYWTEGTGGANAVIRFQSNSGFFPEWEIIGNSVETQGTTSHTGVHWISTTIGKIGGGAGWTMCAQVMCQAHSSAGQNATNYSFAQVTVSSISIIFEKRNQSPTASFQYSPANAIVDQQVAFDASSSYDPDGTIAKYTWAFGDSTTGTGKIVTHSYSLNRTYTVALTVTDNKGGTASISKGVVVEMTPSPTPSPQTEPDPEIVSTAVTDSYGRSITLANIGEPCKITVTVRNPDSVSHEYHIQLAQTGASPLQGGWNTDGLPSWLVTANSLIGVQTSWNANPTYPITSAPAPKTIAPNGTATYTFGLTFNWNWIPPWSWKYLLSCTLVALASGLPSSVGVTLKIIDLVNVFKKNGLCILKEDFGFNVLSGTRKIGVLSVKAQVSESGPKMYAFANCVLASRQAAVATQAGILFPVAREALLVTQALLIAAQNSLYIQAADPNTDYDQVVLPSPLRLNNGTLFSDLPIVKALSENQSTLLQSLVDFCSYQNATAESIIRYAGAVEAGAQDYAILQLQAITEYSTLRDQHFAAFGSHLSQLVSELPPINATSLQLVEEYLRDYGLPLVEQEILSGFGLSPSIDDIAQGMTLFNESPLERPNLATETQILHATLMGETEQWKIIEQDAQQSSSHPALSPEALYAATVIVIAGVAGTVLVTRKRIAKFLKRKKE